MLGLLARAAQTALLALIGWNLATSAWGWPQPRHAPRGGRRRRLRVVVPAHNEEAVIGNVLADLRGADYPAELVDVWVVADRCTDGTARVAAAHARVAERDDGDPGKGAAIQWLLDGAPLGDDEALVVVDADNRVPPDALGRLADELDDGHEVLQAYLDVANPDGSPIATASALTYWAGNRMVQQARRRLGWPADLGGTGMVISAAALAGAGGFGGGLTEDTDLGVRLALAGHPVVWVHDVRFRDEKPQDVGVAVRQRARWMAGKRDVARRRFGELMREARRRRDPGLADLAVRLVQPGRSFVALASGGLAAVSAGTGSRLLFPWPVWGAATAVQVLAPVAFLARDGVPARYLVRYPLVTLIAALWVPVRLVSRTVDRWYHTPHGGS